LRIEPRLHQRLDPIEKRLVVTACPTLIIISEPLPAETIRSLGSGERIVLEEIDKYGFVVEARKRVSHAGNSYR